MKGGKPYPLPFFTKPQKFSFFLLLDCTFADCPQDWA